MTELRELVVLFVSTDWDRKAGGKALEICRALSSWRILTRLIIVGHAPRDARAFDFVDRLTFG